MADRQGLAVAHADQVTYYNTAPQVPQETVPYQVTEGSMTSRGRWLDDIRRKVRYRWIEEVLHRSLKHTVEVELGLAEQPGAVTPTISNRLQKWADPQPLPQGTRLVELYVGPAFGRLAVLGKPGAGKSTELLHLLEDLLDQADADSGKPVPVVLQLSTWDRFGNTAEDALGWLVDQIARRYQAPPDQVALWLKDDQLVLLLDGLDEISDPNRRRDCVTALSALPTAGIPVGMVVCCRTEDYQRIGQRLEFDLAVTVLPLAPEQVDRYLAVAGDALEALRRAVRVDPALAEMLDTPLMLSVATLTSQDPQFQAGLLVDDPDQRLAHLWDRYTAVMLTRQRDPYIEPALGPDRFSPQAAYRHLVWLARLMVQHQRVEIYPDWFGTPWLPGRGSSWRIAAEGPARYLSGLLGWRRTASLVVSLVMAMAIGIPVGLTYGVVGGLVKGLIYGLLCGLIGGLSYWLSEGLPSAKNALAKWRRSWLPAGYALGGLCCGLSYGLAWRAEAAGLFGVSHFVPTDGLGQALASGLLDGAFCGLVGRLVLGVTSAESAGATWRWSWPAAGYGLLGGLCSGVAYGMVYGAGTGRLRGSTGALVAGLVSALALGVINGWRPDFSQPPMTPGKALRRTLRTYGWGITGSLLLAVILSTMLIAVAGTLFPPSHLQSFTRIILAVIGTGLSALMVSVVGKGMIPWIDHLAARFIAAWADFLPRDLLTFLNHSDERIMLRRSGGYYLFLHRTLRDHLAACDPQNPPFPIPSEPRAPE